jgi:hypothetical protein
LRALTGKVRCQNEILSIVRASGGVLVKSRAALRNVRATPHSGLG